MQLPAPIRSWLTTVALPGRRIVAVRGLTGGYSNDNVVVTVTDGGEYVLRRYRRANACAVEAALTARLAGVVPVAEQAAPELAVLRGSHQLVHADFNPKNLLAARRGGRWQVTAVLDWEFAFSSSPLFDIGNMLRDRRPAGFVEAFVDGFRDGGGTLPEDWRRLSRPWTCTPSPTS
jgi:aminoglycoside phosphotransferase (APT) family kinase protein